MNILQIIKKYYDVGGDEKMANKKKKRLYRSEEGSKIFGVCEGIAEYFDIDPTIIRIIWLILVFVYGTGVLMYLICALCMPKKSDLK